jgi:hypothetical protein
MVLRAIGPTASKPALQNAQMADSIDVELFPSVRRTALTFATNLEPEQGLDAMPDAVVVRLDDANASGFVDEFDETRVNDRTYEIVVHFFTT